MEKIREYLNEPIVGIIAPAGYGKTEEIAEAVNVCSGKQLILTHTRAGVVALRERMKRKGISVEKYEIDTIASFCLKWCKAYPQSAGITNWNPNENNYTPIYNGAERLFSYSWARKVIKQSYVGLFVDEYQDCTESQHAIFMKLVGVFPVRVYGDPLQGILYWVSNDKIVNWSSFSFKSIAPLSTPWRWEKTNKTLGSLLDSLRKAILPSLEGNAVTININDVAGCMTVVNTDKWNNGLYAYRIKEFESVVYLSAFPNKQKHFSQYTGGFFQYDEVKDLIETQRIISQIEAERKEKKALVLLESLKEMINGITTELGSYINALSKGRSDFSRISKHKDLGTLIKYICINDNAQSVLDVLRWFVHSGSFKIFRKELLYRIGKTYAYMAEDSATLQQSIDALSRNLQFYERKLSYSRMSSRTVLTKGLEFDCVIIDMRDKMDVRDFYVAMTRAKKYVYIISDTTRLTFNGVRY